MEKSASASGSAANLRQPVKGEVGAVQLEEAGAGYDDIDDVLSEGVDDIKSHSEDGNEDDDDDDDAGDGGDNDGRDNNLGDGNIRSQGDEDDDEDDEDDEDGDDEENDDQVGFKIGNDFNNVNDNNKDEKGSGKTNTGGVSRSSEVPVVTFPGKPIPKVEQTPEAAAAAFKRALDLERALPPARDGTEEELYPFRRSHATGTTWLGWFKNLFMGSLLPKCDLNEEMVEELRMATGFTATEVKHYRQLFLLHVQRRNCITREEFMAIPSIYTNPLRGQLAVCFGFDRMNKKSRVSFRRFFETLSIFNNPTAPRDLKMKMAFSLQDFDGDNMLSRDDLVRYLQLVTKGQDNADLELDFVAGKILEEISSHPLGKFVTLNDFSKVLVSADVTAKLMIPMTLSGD